MRIGRGDRGVEIGEGGDSQGEVGLGEGGDGWGGEGVVGVVVEQEGREGEELGSGADAEVYGLGAGDLCGVFYNLGEGLARGSGVPAYE